MFKQFFSVLKTGEKIHQTVKQEVDYTIFEPLMNHRGIVDFAGIPSCLIKSLDYKAYTTDYAQVTLTLYDAIQPCARRICAELLFDNPYFIDAPSATRWCFIKKSLGPVGDEVSEVSYEDWALESMEFDKMDWSNEKASEIKLIFSGGKRHLLY